MKKTILLIVLTLLLQSEIISQSCLPNGITFSSQYEIDNFHVNYPNCSEIEGNVIISGSDITNLTGLNVVNSYWNNLFIWNNENLTSISGLENVSTVNGSLSIGSHAYGANPSLENLDGLSNLTHVGADIRLNLLYSLTDISALNGIDTVWGTLTFLHCESLTDLSGIDSLQYIGGNLEIYNDDSLSSLQGLDALNYIGGDLLVLENKCLNNLTSLENVTFVGKELTIYNNDSISNLSGLNSISYVGEHLWISGNPLLTTLNGLNSLEVVEEYVSIDADNLEHLHGLSSLSIINDGGIFLSSNALTNLVGLENLTEVNGTINISNCNSLVSLSGIQNISSESISKLSLKNNPLLTMCAVESVCDFISQPWSVTDILDNATGCNTVNEIEDACQIIGVDNIQYGNEPLIYLNPANNKIEFSNNFTERITDLKIYNHLGQQIIHNKIIINSIDISELNQGIYIVEIKTINSRFIQKLIVQ
jgi:hypothetical protein